MEIKIDDLFFVVGQLQKILKKIAGKLSLKTETLKIFDSISYIYNFFSLLNNFLIRSI